MTHMATTSSRNPSTAGGMQAQTSTAAQVKQYALESWRLLAAHFCVADPIRRRAGIRIMALPSHVGSALGAKAQHRADAISVEWCI